MLIYLFLPRSPGSPRHEPLICHEELLISVRVIEQQGYRHSRPAPPPRVTGFLYRLSPFSAHRFPTA